MIAGNVASLITKTIIEILRPPLKRAYNYINQKVYNVFK